MMKVMYLSCKSRGWVCPMGLDNYGDWEIYAEVVVSLQYGVLTFKNQVLIKADENSCLSAILESLQVGGLRDSGDLGVGLSRQYELARHGSRLTHMAHRFPPQSPEVVRDVITRVISAQPDSANQVRIRHITNFREEMESIVEARRNLTHLVCLARSLQEPGTTPSKRDTNLDDLLRPFMLGGITTKALTKLGDFMLISIILDVGSVVHYDWDGVRC